MFQSMYSYAVRHWAKPADPHIVNSAGYTPLTLATKLGRKQIFDEMLELMKIVSIAQIVDGKNSDFSLGILALLRHDMFCLSSQHSRYNST